MITVNLCQLWSRWAGRGVAAMICLGLLAGCVSGYARRQGQGTSVLQFLYPEDMGFVVTADEIQVPELPLPLRVGVAFVPPGGTRSAYAQDAGALTEQGRAGLVKQVAAQFKERPYIGRVEYIPSAYLRAGGGFANLDQVKAMFGVDVIALVAYDQVQFTDQNLLSLAYLTIVGSYLVQGEHNDTQTLMEAAVYDIGSRQLLFRAPGVSQVKALSTPAFVEQSLREDSARGFTLASEDMLKNLETALAEFQVRAKEEPASVRFRHRSGYTGAGAWTGWWALGLLGVGWLVRRRESDGEARA
jgi:rhombotail lipoprotein